MKKNLEENLRFLPYIIILSSILFLLKITWMKWGDVIIDSGREMYIPLEIARGKVLYTTIHYIYGPFHIYFHALLYKLFGPHINVLIICGIVITFLTAIMLYKISRFSMSPICSSLVSLTFVFICAFGNYVYPNNYNFILPYTYAATYGILFSLIAIYFFIKFINNDRLRDILFYGIFCSFVLLCKIEIGISLLIPTIIILFFYKKSLIPIIISLSPIFILVIVYSLFSVKTDILTMLNKNYMDAMSENNKLFTSRLLGTTDTAGNIYLIVHSLILYIFILLCFLSFDYILNNLKDNIAVRVLITFTIYLVTFIIIIIVRNLLSPYTQYRALPIVFLITIFFSIKKREIITLYIALFSFLLITRIILRISAAHYGFYMLVPGLVPYYLFFYNIIPKTFQRFTKNGLYFLSIAILLVLLILNHLNIYIPVYKNRELKIYTKRGTVNYLNNIIGVRYKELLNYLIDNTEPDETLVVFPEGIDVNFFTGLNNPIFYNTFLPFELAKDGKEEEIISQTQKSKVDYIVIIQVDTTEYGPSSFGIDYGKKLFSWIKNNYEITKTFGPMPFTTDEFGIAVMKRTDT